MYELYHAGQGTRKTHNKTIMNTLRPGLYGDVVLATVRLPQGSLFSKSFGK